MNRLLKIRISALHSIVDCRLWALLIIVGCGGNCFGQEQPLNQTFSHELGSHSKIRPPAAESIDENVLDEINSIRLRLGGGVASQLQGLIKESPGSNGTFTKSVFSAREMQHYFDAEFRRLSAASKSPSPQARDSAAGISVDSQSKLISTRAGRMLGQPISLTHSLRRAAQNLELAAAALEEASRFEQADVLREKARSLWVEARNQTERGRLDGMTDVESKAANR